MEVLYAKQNIFFILLILLCVLVMSCDRDSNLNERYILSTVDHAMIEAYIDEHVTDEGEDEQVLSVHEVLGSDQGAGKIYLWVMAEGYMTKANRIVKTSGLSQPVLLKVSDKSGDLEIIEHASPRDGNDYPKDIKKMFPDFIIDKFDNVEEKLREELEKKFRELE